ncbi:RNA polymerase sigma factor [Nocardia bovistercoris]|uniref:Sigma-70 family RNA polymerase sigma factor n=1 Tax=Nocardia bovistercoris TaxID=2785916 RepID=A0A931N472_9NOCA|nr:sigma-70 family RNA polymerase sigma factor [Nocardia bovistercoris]MBH0781430.1 sigma-70 family RNA polymerase sigma factor [Nocardia bovistercoris]
MTSNLTPECAWSVAGVWYVSWLPAVGMSRRAAMLEMTIDDLLSDPDLVDDIEIFGIIAHDGEQMGVPARAAVLALATRMLDRLQSAPRLATALVTAESAAERAEERARRHETGEDQAEFTTFYRSFVAQLVAFLIRHGAQRADAADLAQETMIEAYRSWARITSPTAWCFHVSYRKLQRSRASRTEVANEALPLPEQRSPLCTPDIELADRDFTQRILALLPHRQRQVMAWTMFGFTPKEIADELKITPEAVRSSLKKARQTLATTLDRGSRRHR